MLRPFSAAVRLVAAVVVLCCAMAQSSRAQTVDAAILGSIHDSAGVGLSGVAVTARNTATGVQWTINTTATGRFSFLQLPLGGPYTITARRIGFRPEVR